jgi:hypothetical protein
MEWSRKASDEEMTGSNSQTSAFSARGAAALLASAVVGLFASAAASADGSRLTDIRIGQHPEFRRIVLVFDVSPDVARLDRGDETLELEIHAKAERERTYFGTSDSPIGAVELIQSRWTNDAGDARTGLRFRARLDGRRARVFALTSPARLVVDIAPPGEAAFEAPGGTVAIFERSPAESRPPVALPDPAPQPRPEAAVEPLESVEPEPARAPPVVPRVQQPVPEITLQREPPGVGLDELPGPREERSPQSGDDEILPDRPVIQHGSDAESRSEAAPQSEPDPRQAALDRSQVPDSTPSVAEAPAPPAAPAQSAAEGVGSVFWRGLWVVGALIGAVALWLVFSRSFRSSVDSESSLSDAVELETASRLEALEKRMDEDARARLAMEERLLHLHEELKVMRDRLTRRARRPD